MAIIKYQPTISDINFEEEDVIKAIDEIKENSTTGPDHVPGILLKKCKHSGYSHQYYMEKIS